MKKLCSILFLILISLIMVGCTTYETKFKLVEGELLSLDHKIEDKEEHWYFSFKNQEGVVYGTYNDYSLDYRIEIDDSLDTIKVFYEAKFIKELKGGKVIKTLEEDHDIFSDSEIVIKMSKDMFLKMVSTKLN